MRSLTRIKNEPNLRKDVNSGAVVNVSSDDYNKYIQRKEIIRKNNDRLENLEKELTEVKDLLRSVVDTLTNVN